MKYLFITTFALFCTLEAKAINSTLKIPYSECSKYPYAHVIGGTMHSRFVAKKRLMQKAETLTAYSSKEAFKQLKKQYPALELEHIKLAVKSCRVYFKASSKKNIYYFDAGNLALLQTKEP